MTIADFSSSISDPEQVLSVSELTAQIKDTLEETFPAVWVSGEISNLARPQSGHVYFSLKDEKAQLRTVMWRNAASKLRFDLEDGQEVVCQGTIDVYPPRGSYQLVIRQLEPRGVGALQLALRQLQARLGAEGLFDPQHKKRLPAFPRKIAFVTSPTGAAIRDFLEVVRRRWHGVEILVIPARVQGEGSAEEIAAGIEIANRLASPPDVLVVGRGGGSVEDLWCFNDEKVVRAIFASEIPVVSAVGHEIDVTLSDLVADVRALTPSEAAELVVPAMDEINQRLRGFEKRLAGAMRHVTRHARVRLDDLASRRVLVSPLDRIRELSRRLDELEMRSQRAIQGSLSRTREMLMGRGSRLDSLSPLGVLSRGYSVTVQNSTGEIVRDIQAISSGELMTTRVRNGKIISRVEAVSSEDDFD